MRECMLYLAHFSLRKVEHSIHPIQNTDLIYIITLFISYNIFCHALDFLLRDDGKVALH